MAITQEFKDKCQKLLTDGNNLINSPQGGNWGANVAEVVKANKGVILDGDFFRECGRWNGEQRAYFYNLLAVAYVNHPIRDRLNACSGENNQNRTGSAMLEMSELAFNWFSKVKADRGADMDQYNQEQTNRQNAERARDQAQADKATAEKQRDDAKAAQAAAEKARDTANTALNSWTSTFPNQDPGKVKADKDTLQTNLTDRENTIKDKDAIIDKLKDLPDKVKVLQTSLDAKDTELNERANAINTLAADKAKAEQERDVAKNDAAQHLKDYNAAQAVITQKDAEIERLKQQQGQTQGEGTKALNKLLAIYTAEIKKRTELFYQELSLDNNQVNEKYGDKNTQYLDLLKNLNADSDPEQAIGAFRIIALIKATEKAQATTDKYNDRIATLPANLKKNNLNGFKKVNDTGELITDEPQADNNPLYLPVIQQQADYRTKIKNIIKIWQ